MCPRIKTYGKPIFHGFKPRHFFFQYILYPEVKFLGSQLFYSHHDSVLGRIMIEIGLARFQNLSLNLTRQILIIIIFSLLFRFIDIDI